VVEIEGALTVGAHSQILNHDAPEPADSDATGLAAAMYASKYYQYPVREHSRGKSNVRVHRGGPTRERVSYDPTRRRNGRDHNVIGLEADGRASSDGRNGSLAGSVALVAAEQRVVHIRELEDVRTGHSVELDRERTGPLSKLIRNCGSSV
jgi:hypothetical protein